MAVETKWLDAPKRHVPSKEFVRILGELTSSPDHQVQLGRRIERGVRAIHDALERRNKKPLLPELPADVMSAESTAMKARCDLLSAYSSATPDARKWLIQFVTSRAEY